MKEKYVSSVKSLELAVREANDLIKLMEKYNPETSYGQSLFSIAHVHQMLLREIITNYHDICREYLQELTKKGLMDVVKKIGEDQYKNNLRAESVFDRISSILSYTFKI